MNNFDVDEDLEGDDSDDDELFVIQGQEGVPLWDSLGEGFLKEVSQSGLSLSYCFLTKFVTLFQEGKLLDEDDLTLICAYSLKLKHSLTNDAYNSLWFFFPPA